MPRVAPGIQQNRSCEKQLKHFPNIDENYKSDPIIRSIFSLLCSSASSFAPSPNKPWFLCTRSSPGGDVTEAHLQNRRAPALSVNLSLTPHVRSGARPVLPAAAPAVLAAVLTHRGSPAARRWPCQAHGPRWHCSTSLTLRTPAPPAARGCCSSGTFLLTQQPGGRGERREGDT